MPQREDKNFPRTFQALPERLSVRDSTCAIWHGSCNLVRDEGGAASVLAYCPAYPVEVQQSKEKTMTQLVPESWQQTLGHLRDNIRGTIDAGGIDLRLTVGSGQVEVMYRAGTFSAPSWPFRAHRDTAWEKPMTS